MKKCTSNRVIDEIRIRNMDENVVLKLDGMAKKHGMNRSEYLRGILTNHAYAPEIKELDSRYQELFKIVIEAVQGNSELLHEVLVELRRESHD